MSTFADAHWIAPKLWQGSAPTDAHDLSAFDVVVLCAREHQPVLARVREVVRCPIDDGEVTATMKVRRASIYQAYASEIEALYR